MNILLNNAVCTFLNYVWVMELKKKKKSKNKQKKLLRKGLKKC